MALSCQEVSLPKPATGVVVRPRTTTSSGSTDNAGPRGGVLCPAAQQTLILFGNEARELLEEPAAAAEGGGGGSGGAAEPSLIVSAQPLQLQGQLSSARHPVYDTATDAILFVEGYAVKRLDRRNAVSLVAGSEGEWGFADGAGGDARFRHIVALAGDGAGRVFVAEKKSIRSLDVASGAVTTLRGSEPTGQSWICLSYNAAAGMLVAATSCALYHFPPYGSGGSAAATPRLIAGSPDAATVAAAAAAAVAAAGDDADGGVEDNVRCSTGGDSSCCSSSCAGNSSYGGSSSGSSGGSVRGGGSSRLTRFSGVRSILAAADGTVFVGEQGRLRSVDAASGAVSSHPATGANEGYFPWQMTLLPCGRLALSSYGSYRLVVLSGGIVASVTAAAASVGAASASAAADVKADSQARSAVASALLDSLALSVGGSGGAAAAGGAANTLSVITRDGRVFVAHRGVLASRSEVFKQLLEEGDGFADSGAGGGRVRLPDADPEAFGRLLVYMYTGELDVPEQLLRPTAALAARLLLPAECVSELRSRLLATVTPGSVVGDLVWAEQHGASELVAPLRAYLLRHRKEVAAEPGARTGLLSLITTHPEMAAELVMTLLAL